jgi:hypothetical protein
MITGQSISSYFTCQLCFNYAYMITQVCIQYHSFVLPAWTGGSLEDLRHNGGISKAPFMGTSGSIKSKLSKAHGISLEYLLIPDDELKHARRPNSGLSEAVCWCAISRILIVQRTVIPKGRLRDARSARPEPIPPGQAGRRIL